MSKWLIALDDQDREMTMVVKGTKEQAEKAAQELFDQYRYDSGRDFEEPDDMPSVIVYEIEKFLK